MEQDVPHIMEHSAFEAIALYQNQAHDLFLYLSLYLCAFRNFERIPKNTTYQDQIKWVRI